MTTSDKYDVKQLDDRAYPYVSLSVGLDATHEQKAAAFKKWKLDDQGMTWPDFFHTATRLVLCDGAIALPWCGMTLCIEEDGYTHT